MRGKVVSVPADWDLVRITPACAGKSPYSQFVLITGEDHPRVCGEKFYSSFSWRGFKGSPPRVRGKVLPMFINRLLGRITPACAGKSFENVIGTIVCQDHPRVCGEKRRQSMMIPKSLGSPPRVRGKEAFESSYWKNRGITPACAGKRGHAAQPCTVCKDHPRVCGEKKFVIKIANSNIGSPPRVRGKGKYRSHWIKFIRITPACAGKRETFSNSYTGG